MPDGVSWTALLSALSHLALVAAFSVRVIWKRRPAGVSLAWITLLTAAPLVGVVAYLMLAEPWLSSRRTRRTAAVARRLLRSVIELRGRHGVSMSECHAASAAAQALGDEIGFIPTLGGNEVRILDGAGDCFSQLIADIDAATTSCDLLFYIWSPGGVVAHVEAALVRAQQRGVRCRVLVDAVGGKPLLRRAGDALRAAGIEVRPALPVGLLRTRLSRVDLRNHRKLVVIDDKVGYTGSLNMADPAIFKRGAGVGRWVDVMARVHGPSAGLLGALFELDWSLEDNDEPDVESWVPQDLPTPGHSAVQVAPSGPGQYPKAVYRMLLSAIHGARERLVLTTPYLVPDDAFMEALAVAAQRGVETNLVVPAKINGPLVSLATWASCAELLDAGVNVWAYDGGLLHAKTITADAELGVVGTMNLDRRSFALNYELSLILHGGPAVREIARVQDRYLRDSTPLDQTPWARRRWPRRLAENTAMLFSPLL